MDCVDNDKLIPRIDLSIKCTDNGNNYYFDTKMQVQDPNLLLKPSLLCKMWPNLLEDLLQTWSIKSTNLPHSNNPLLNTAKYKLNIIG
jgi:hypothetical protein